MRPPAGALKRPGQRPHLRYTPLAFAPTTIVMSAKHARLLILGSGPAGYTAAVYAARANLKPVLITGLAQGGQLMTTTDVDNWPADADGVQGPDLMAALPAARRALRDRDRSSTTSTPSTLESSARSGCTGDNGEYTCDALIIATGASARYLGLPVGAGVHGQGRVRLRDLRRLLLQGAGRRRGRRRQHRGRGSAVPVEHRASNVTVVHRRDKFRAEAILVDRLMAKTQGRRQHARRVEPHARRSARRRARASPACACVDAKTGATQELPVHGVFIAIGHTPNTQIFEGQLDMAGGYIKVKGGSRRQRDRDQRAGRVRRGRRRRPRLSPGGHLRRHRLHGGARRRGVSSKST